VATRHRSRYCIVLVEPFMLLHEVENPLLVVFSHADLHRGEDVFHSKIAHHTGNASNEVSSIVNLASGQFRIGSIGVGIAPHSMFVVILLGMLLIRWELISNFDWWTLTLKTTMLLKIM
jgi:hypothetical protein